MITYKIEDGDEQEVSDFLGEDGARRDGVYPTRIVTYYDNDTEQILGAQTYSLRSSSAIQTEADIIIQADETLAKFQANPNWLQGNNEI